MESRDDIKNKLGQNIFNYILNEGYFTKFKWRLGYEPSSFQGFCKNFQSIDNYFDDTHWIRSLEDFEDEFSRMGIYVSLYLGEDFNLFLDNFIEKKELEKLDKFEYKFELTTLYSKITVNKWASAFWVESDNLVSYINDLKSSKYRLREIKLHVENIDFLNYLINELKININSYSLTAALKLYNDRLNNKLDIVNKIQEVLPKEEI